MTTINVIVQRDAVHMCTDTTTLECDNYTVNGFMRKHTKVRFVPAVIAMRGYVMVEKEILSAIERAGISSFDELKSQLFGIVVSVCGDREAFWNSLISNAEHRPGKFNLIVAGLSETAGPQAFCISRIVEPNGNYRMNIETGDSFISPSSDRLNPAWNACSIALAEQHFNNPFVEVFVLELMKEQRRLYGMVTGGDADITTIAADGGISYRRVPVFGDKIGDRLEPGYELSDEERATSLMIAAQAVTAGKINTGDITSDSGVIGALSVKSLSIGDNAITAPKTQVLFNQVTGFNSGVSGFSISFDTTGLAGKTLCLYANFVGNVIYAGGSGISTTATLYIDGNLVSQTNAIDRTGSSIAAGGYDFVASGGPQALSVSVDWSSGPNAFMNRRTLYAVVTIR